MSDGAPILLATTIFVLQEGGHYKQYHRGEAVPGLNKEQVDRLTKCGALGSAEDLAPEPGPGEPDETDAGGRPASNANKATLVAWVVANLTKPDGTDYTAEELDDPSTTKAVLWDLIDSAEE